MSYADVDPSNKGIMIPIRASRPLLVFNHNPKAGGSSIKNYLQKFKNRTVLCKHDYNDYGCPPEVWKKALDGDVDRTLVVVQEYSGSVPTDRAHGFVIGNIREPCSQYLSLWSFGSKGGGAFVRSFKNRTDLYGLHPPFNSTSDKERFKNWMQHHEVKGIIQKRLIGSYGTDGTDIMDSVDCWVVLEDFEWTLWRCLRLYEDQGGFVDWKDPLIAKLPTPKTRNQIHHGKCRDMYDNEMATQIEEQSDPLIYDLFGYERCCASTTNFYSRVSIPTAGENISQFSLPFETKQKITSEFSDEGFMPALKSQVPIVRKGTMVCVLLLIFYRYRHKWRSGESAAP